MAKQIKSSAYLFSFTFNGNLFPDDILIVANGLDRAVMLAEIYQEQHEHLRGSEVDHVRKIQVSDIVIDPDIYAAQAD